MKKEKKEKKQKKTPLLLPLPPSVETPLLAHLALQPAGMTELVPRVSLSLRDFSTDPFPS